MRLVLFPPVGAGWLAEIASAAPTLEVINAATREQASEAMGEADAFYGEVTPDLLAAASRLRWIQAPRIGLEHTMFPALAQSDVVLTNVRGIYNDVIADHVWSYILCFARGLHRYLRRQLAHWWERGAPVVHLADSTLGIVGLGGIGGEVARRGAAFGMRVVAVDARRTDAPEGLAALWGVDRLDELLATSDFVVLCTPHTPETEKLIGAAQLRRMKRTAFLINVGRGVVVDLAALTEALQEGTIAGAGLDVFEVEPLPDDHPLWAMPNVIVTPHTAGVNAGGHVDARRRAVVLDNLRRFVAGAPLHNVVDKTKWF
jgi:phosphoglycerate dehydrogenase-like enzyme